MALMICIHIFLHFCTGGIMDNGHMRGNAGNEDRVGRLMPIQRRQIIHQAITLFKKTAPSQNRNTGGGTFESESVCPLNLDLT